MPALTVIRRSKLASAAFLGLFGVSSLVYSPIAKAQVADGIGFVAKLAGATPAGPLLECASFLLSLYNTQNDREQARSLKDIAAKIDDLAGKQDKILAALADQRIVMREELKAAFLNNDCRELQAVSNRFKIAMANGPQKANETELNALRGRADELATKLSLYGLAGVPAYLNAIALQNALHMVVHSSPEAFVVINQKHAQNLEAMLNGSGSDTVLGLAKATFDLETVIQAEHKAGLGSWDDLRALHDYGKSYPMGLVQEFYEPETTLQSMKITVLPQVSLLFGYEYKGFRAGEPILLPYIRNEGDGILVDYSIMKYGADNSKKIPVRAAKPTGPAPSFFIPVPRDAFFVTGINGLVSSDHLRIPELQGTKDWLGNTEVGVYTVSKNGEGNYTIPHEAWKLIYPQGEAIRRYYGKVYSSKMGEVSQEQDERTFQKESPACREMTAMLGKGLEAIRSIEQTVRRRQAIEQRTAQEMLAPAGP